MTKRNKSWLRGREERERRFHTNSSRADWKARLLWQMQNQLIYKYKPACLSSPGLSFRIADRLRTAGLQLDWTLACRTSRKRVKWEFQQVRQVIQPDWLATTALTDSARRSSTPTRLSSERTVSSQTFRLLLLTQIAIELSTTLRILMQRLVSQWIQITRSHLIEK